MLYIQQIKANFYLQPAHATCVSHFYNIATTFVGILTNCLIAHDCCSHVDRICDWCTKWRMVLNKSKCKIQSITKNKYPVKSTYKLQDAEIEATESQKDLGHHYPEMEPASAICLCQGK